MSKRISGEDAEIQRRLSWSTFNEITEIQFLISRNVIDGGTVIDKLQSLYYGSPASIQEADTSVPYILVTAMMNLSNRHQWSLHISYPDRTLPSTARLMS